MDRASRTLSVATAGSRLEFDLDRGLFSVMTDEGVLFEKAAGRVLWSGDRKPRSVTTKGSWEEAARDGSAVVLSKKEEWGRLLFRMSPRGGALVLELGLVWEDGEEPPGVDAVVPLEVPAGKVWPGRDDNRSWRFYHNGWQCWTPSGVLKPGRPGDYMFVLFTPERLKPMLANTATPVSSEKGHFTGEWFGGLADVRTGDSAVVGFTGVKRALSQVSVRFGGKKGGASLAAAARFEGKRPGRAREFWGEPLAVVPGDLTGRNLEAYAELVAEDQGARKRRSPVGWCSWYHYFRGVTAGDVESNLSLIADKYEPLGIEVVQVDDGYQSELGDWLETGGGFPGGMERLAEEIAAGGRIPGIWVAPFTVMRRSRLFREKKDWVLRDRKGRPILAGFNPMWKGRFYGIDPSHPGVLEWLRGLFGTLRGYGYRFFKLDFLASGLLEGERFDRTVTRAEAARRALEVIREAVGDDSCIMAAGGPVLLGTGVFDVQRLGPDVAPYWRSFYQPLLRDRSTPAARNCLISVFTRYFLHGRLFEGDPDCMLLRGSGSKLTLPERQTLASAVCVLGGAVMFSDDMSLWGDEEQAMAAAMLPAVRGKLSCPEIWKEEIPGFLVSRLEDARGPYFLVWGINWRAWRRDLSSTLAGLGVDPGLYHAHEFWTGEYLGTTSEKVSVEDVPAHGSAVIRLTPAGGGPRLLGSNLHISQGAVELESLEETAGGARMVLRSPVRRRARITVEVPGEGEARARDEGGAMAVERIGKSTYRLEFEIEGSKVVELSRGK